MKIIMFADSAINLTRYQMETVKSITVKYMTSINVLHAIADIS